jgi:FAD/FMN-containing dehydrogenase
MLKTAHAVPDSIGHLVVGPGDPEWDQARRPWNFAHDQNPAFVAFPESAEDVVAIVEHARRNGLRVAPQGTGHNAGPLADLHDTILLSTSRMKGVDIDAEGRRARVSAGTLWLEVTEPASELGLAPLAGSSIDVGVVGYCLGGGVSWLGRKHGLAANSVLAIEVVTADGRLRRVDHDNDPDLFWALRGGGGSFGVVTAMEIALYPLPELYAGAMWWPWDRSSEVMHAWREWTLTVPDEVTSSARIMQIPPLPEIPEFMRGRSFVTIDAAIIGDRDRRRDRPGAA